LLRILGIVFLVLLVAAGALALDAFWLEPSSLRTAEHTLHIDGAKTANIDGLRIAVIADLHAGAPFIDRAKIDEVVRQTMAAHPDLILLAGDYTIDGVLGGHYMPIEKVAEALKPLHAPLGVYAVPGNHDNWRGVVRVAIAFQKAGIPLLVNHGALIARNHKPLWIAGIDDFYTGPSDVNAALRGAPVHKALCLTHSPDVFPLLPATCLLTIAAHTHGGQVKLPFIGRPIVPSHYGQRYAAGLVWQAARYLYVCTGIGTSMLPVRFGVPPEVTVLDIK
jgi:predicted MPP superfamily phosphohydrolase